MQTSLRGEITAAISALKFGVSSTKPCRLWVDNQNVFDILTSLQEDAAVEVNNKADADLWEQLVQQFRLARHNLVAIVKVLAHA